MHILQLPVELHQEILFNLAWHEHFIASQVCQRWAFILASEKFRRKRYVYDKIRSEKPPPMYQIDWGFQRYLPQDEGPPWRSRKGGELSLHGLLWSETLIIVLKREKGDIKSRLLITTDAIAYLDEPKGLGLLKQFHEKRYGRRSLYDITDSPLLDSDKIYFWGKGKAKTQESVGPFSVKGVGYPGSTADGPHISHDQSENEESGPQSVPKKTPAYPPVVLFNGPAHTRAYQLKAKKREQYMNNPMDLRGLPTSERGSWTIDDFEHNQYEHGAAPLYYPGSNGDSIREFTNGVKEHLVSRLFEGKPSNLGFWGVFDIDHRHLHPSGYGPKALSQHDPRRVILVATTVLQT
ncbi:hypothetical protein TWF718_006439 [Orbilia javanica]|uniref:F-box domain-containing protein n=1 Tax=Orbilia javanica TaxID=47235 RepID=A0AAN8NYG2_9PEZI